MGLRLPCHQCSITEVHRIAQAWAGWSLTWGCRPENSVTCPREKQCLPQIRGVNQRVGVTSLEVFPPDEWLWLFFKCCGFLRQAQMMALCTVWMLVLKSPFLLWKLTMKRCQVSCLCVLLCSVSPLWARHITTSKCILISGKWGLPFALTLLRSSSSRATTKQSDQRVPCDIICWQIRENLGYPGRQTKFSPFQGYENGIVIFISWF